MPKKASCCLAAKVKEFRFYLRPCLGPGLPRGQHWLWLAALANDPAVDPAGILDQVSADQPSHWQRSDNLLARSPGGSGNRDRNW